MRTFCDFGPVPSRTQLTVGSRYGISIMLALLCILVLVRLGRMQCGNYSLGKVGVEKALSRTYYMLRSRRILRLLTLGLLKRRDSL